MRTAGADEFRLQVFPVVVVTPSYIGARALVDDRSITVEETAGDRKEVVVRNIKRSDRQALTRRDTHDEQPAAERGVADLRSVEDASRAGANAADLVVLPEALEQMPDQLTIGARKADRPASSDAAVGRDETDGVGESGSPLRVSGRGNSAPVLFRQNARHGRLPPMRCRGPR